MPPYSYQLRHDRNGRIIEKQETVAGKSVTWKYSYDKEGRLFEAHLGGRLICQCLYDKQGRRIRDYLPATAGSGYRDYQYTMDNRLLRAGNNTYTHDDNGFRSIWSNGGTYHLYEYAPDYRLLKMEVEDQNRVYTYHHDDNGQRAAKYLNGQLAEAYQWFDFIRLGAFHDGHMGYTFDYADNARLPSTMRREDGAVFTLHYDQVGSLRVVADAHGNMIKEVLYDPFGGIIEDTNPCFRVPIGFAGGLHDRDLGFVRFGWRDYDVNTGRWTAPDPIGDKGGDPDWYGYCLDDPVNNEDATGLNPLVAWAPYIPAFNSIGKWAAEDVMDGRYGFIDLAKDGLKAYGGYVKNNVKKMKENNKLYYDELYGRNKQEDDKPNETTPSAPKGSPDKTGASHKKTNYWWGR